MRIGSLFAGIGGFDLAARWMGWETAWFSEIDPYASAVLAKHWPGVPNHGDITKIDFTAVEPVDLLCGGFPCQDISNAGKREGIGGKRSGLWSEYARAVGELRPRYVVVENVAALLGRGVERVLGDLAALGYDAEWQVLSAAEVGAPHLRERLWIVAYPGCEHGDWRTQFRPRRSVSNREGSSHGSEAERAAQRRSEDVADPDRRGWEGRSERGLVCSGEQCRAAARHTVEPILDTGRQLLEGWQQGQPAQPAGIWATEPDVGRVAHGVPARVDRLRCLGNSLVPECAFVIFLKLAEGIEPSTPALRVRMRHEY